MKPAEKTLAGAVAETVKHLDLEPADAATVALALTYAQAVDALTDEERPRLIGTIGPGLLRCLQQLGASPWARAEIGKRAKGHSGESELARLRAARRPG